MRMSVIFAALLSVASPLQAMTGEELAIQADARIRGFHDQSVSLRMELINPAGERAERMLRVQSLEYPEGEKTLMIFDTPRDLRGSALLSHTHPQGDDEQWLYLPVVKRVKQIGARNKSGPFMASEFAFEDIVTPFWQKFTYGNATQVELNGLACYQFERISKDSYSAYSRQIVWLDRENLLVRRIDYYDRKNSLLKTYEASDFSLHADKHWRPAQMHMRNHQNGKQTRLTWQDFVFAQGLQDADFSQNALLRAR